MKYNCRFDLSRRPMLCGGSEGIALPAPADESDLRPLCTYVEDQGNSEGCVGEAFEGGLFIPTRVRYSPRGIWKDARFKEKVRRQDPIENVGCDPADAHDALLSLGPYPRDKNDDDPSMWNVGETLAEAECRRLVPQSALMWITPGDTDTVDRVLTAGFGVVYWGQIDAAYQELGAGQVWPGLTGPSLGGHARVIIAHNKPAGWYGDWNSWGAWADSGFGRIARSVVESGQVGLCAVLGGP